MISNWSEEAQEIIIKAKLEMSELKHPYVGTEHLVLAILHTKNELSERLNKYNLNYLNFKNEILKTIGKGTKKSEFYLYTPLLKKVIENAIIDSKENNNGIVTINHLFGALLEIGEGIAIRIFIGMNFDLDNIYDEFTEKIYHTKSNKKLLIEELGININERAKNNEIDPVIGREKEIKKIEEILCRRTKNNPLLIGEPGVGKTAIIEALANLIENDDVPSKLAHKKIISLDMASAVSGTKYRGEFEERMKKIIEEIENHEEIILFIDEIHTLIGAGGAEGAIDASNILKPALARGKIRCIGATTKDEYKKHFEKDKALERRFQLIDIEEPSIEETKHILIKLKPIYENYHNVCLKDDIIDKLVTLSEKYLYNRYRPDKQIDILDEVCSKVGISKTMSNIKLNNNIKDIRNKKELYIEENNIKKAYEYKVKETKLSNKMSHQKERRIVTIEDIATVISNKSSIPIYEILKDNKRSINEISTLLKDNIIGQNEVITKLIDITKRIKLGYKDNKCTSLLFIGPTGTGKTKLANLYGHTISKQIIKIDMSEYADSSSISKLLGTNAGYIGYDDNKYILNKIKDNPNACYIGYDDNKYILNKIKDNPNAVIILDDIDKAHPKIINLLYQILEEGKILDAKNNLINFNNNIIIMTSNKGIDNTSIGFNNNEDKINLNETFNTSFLNRIDNILIFKQLNKIDITKIIKHKLNELKDKYQEINININDNIINKIIEESNYKINGARTINKIINNKIENIIIDSIIDNNKEINIDSLFSK